MSNKTHGANAKKTKSAPKLRKLVIILPLAFLAVVGLAVIAARQPDNDLPASRSDNSQAVCLRQPDSTEDCLFRLERADTAAKRTQGLSGRQSLATGSGMLFEFEQPANQCMWMKDMRFAIDMLWLDDQKRIIKIEPAVRPESYPVTYCAANAKYVIELDNGAAAGSNLQTGQQLKF